MPGGRFPLYEVLSGERVEGPLTMRKLVTMVDSGKYSLDQSMRKKGSLNWEPIRVTMQRNKTQALVGLPIMGTLFLAGGAFFIWISFQSFVPGSKISPPSHVLGVMGVFIVAGGMNLGFLTYNGYVAPLGKFPRKMSVLQIVLFWSALIAGLLAVCEIH